MISKGIAAAKGFGMVVALRCNNFKTEDYMIFNKLAKSIFVIVLVLFCGQAVWAADNADNYLNTVPEFKVQVRILDLTLAKVEGKHRVTHMIAELVRIDEPEGLENNSELKSAYEYLKTNAKQVTIMVTPEAEKQGKLLGFFNFFINGIHKTGVFKADSTMKVFQLQGINGWQMLLTECNLLDQGNK